MNVLAHSEIRVRAAALFLVAGCVWAQTRSGAPPRFEDYPASEIFSGTPTAPKLAPPAEQSYAEQIRDGVEKGYGVFRDSKEQRGPNFAGNQIVIQWGCGAPCLRMAIVDARTGDVYYPPISINGVGARSFDLPLLMIGDSVPQNPEVQFRLNSSLMIINATPNQSGRQPSYTYYFLWRQNRWTLLRKVPLVKNTGTVHSIHDYPFSQTPRCGGGFAGLPPFTRIPVLSRFLAICCRNGRR